MEVVVEEALQDKHLAREVAEEELLLEFLEAEEAEKQFFFLKIFSLDFHLASEFLKVFFEQQSKPFSLVF